LVSIMRSKQLKWCCVHFVKQCIAVVSVMDLMLMLIELKMFYFIEVFLIWQEIRISVPFTIFAS
jgi:hypothetical protein